MEVILNSLSILFRMLLSGEICGIVLQNSRLITDISLKYVAFVPTYPDMRKNTNRISSAKNIRTKLLWSALFLLIAAATIGTVVSQGKTFSFDSFVLYIESASKGWMIAAAACMLGFILFEGEAIVTVCHAFGYSASRKRGFLYSAADIYFSAITPSATGGQPACAYFMIKDGIPGSVTTVALLINLTMYTVSILALGLATLFIRPDLFLSFSLLSKILVLLGYLAQAFLTGAFLLLLLKNDFLHGICRKTLHSLCKIRLLRNETEKQQKLDDYMREYAMYAQMIREHKKMLLKVFLLNLLQRISVISVPMFVFLASGEELIEAAEIWAIQCYAVIGSNTVPIPGAMGVSDYIMLDGFSKVLPLYDVIDFELLSRSLSFYICVLLCGITVLAQYWMQRKREKE